MYRLPGNTCRPSPAGHELSQQCPLKSPCISPVDPNPCKLTIFFVHFVLVIFFFTNANIFEQVCDLGRRKLETDEDPRRGRVHRPPPPAQSRTSGLHHEGRETTVKDKKTLETEQPRSGPKAGCNTSVRVQQAQLSSLEHSTSSLL